MGLEMGDPPAAVVPDSVVDDALGFAVFLPRPIEPSGDDRLRVRLGTTLYDAAAAVSAEAFGRSGESLPQQVEPGDASAEVGTDQLRVLVVATSLENVLGEVAVEPRAFTPQGDGVNDQVRITYTLFSVRSACVEADVLTLDGSMVRRLHRGAQSAGRHAQTWDGRNDAGAQVAPGLYLLRVSVDAGRGSAAPIAAHCRGLLSSRSTHHRRRRSLSTNTLDRYFSRSLSKDSSSSFSSCAPCRNCLA